MYRADKVREEPGCGQGAAREHWAADRTKLEKGRKGTNNGLPLHPPPSTQIRISMSSLARWGAWSPERPGQRKQAGTRRPPGTCGHARNAAGAAGGCVGRGARTKRLKRRDTGERRACRTGPQTSSRPYKFSHLPPTLQCENVRQYRCGNPQVRIAAALFSRTRSHVRESAGFNPSNFNQRAGSTQALEEESVGRIR